MCGDENVRQRPSNGYACHLASVAHLVVPGETDGVIAHAQLVFDNGMIMLCR